MVFDALVLLGFRRFNADRPRLVFFRLEVGVGDGFFAVQVKRAGKTFQRPAVERVRPLAVALVDGENAAQVAFVGLHQGVAVALEFVNVALQEVDVRRVQRLQVVLMHVGSDGGEFLFAVVVVDQKIGAQSQRLFVFVVDDERFRRVIGHFFRGLSGIALHAGSKEDGKEKNGESFHHKRFRSWRWLKNRVSLAWNPPSAAPRPSPCLCKRGGIVPRPDRALG